jgi:hypothetical protein
MLFAFFLAKQHQPVAHLHSQADSSIQLLSASEKPDVSYNDIGGMDVQKQVRDARSSLQNLSLSYYSMFLSSRRVLLTLGRKYGKPSNCR